LNQAKEGFRLRKILIAIVAGAALATSAAALAATVVVSPSNTDGWTAVHESCNAVPSTGSQAFVNGPGTPPAGTGSYEFRTGANAQSYETFRQRDFNGTKLMDITALDYWTYVSAFGTGSSGQAPYIDLYVDNDGNGTKDDTLTFEPVYQTSQGTVALNTWQHWDALHGNWWAESTGGPPPFTTLAQYAAAHPGAAIADDQPGGFLLSSGCGNTWANFVGNADKLTINDTTYDFELGAGAAGPPTSKAQCKHGGWRNFTNPKFKNQGQCVSYVNHHDGKGKDDDRAGKKPAKPHHDQGKHKANHGNKK
jgi:uncharacterized membrane protein